MRIPIPLALIGLALGLLTCSSSEKEASKNEEPPKKVLTGQQPPDKWLVTMEEATSYLKENDKVYGRFIQNGTMHVGMYQPKGMDQQRPHEQDEVYIIMQGTGTFINGDQKSDFKAGDVLFVAAGEEHRFENFSEDFLTWVVFYGPEGGEKE